MCVKEGRVSDPGLQLGLLLAGATPGKTDNISKPQANLG